MQTRGKSNFFANCKVFPPKKVSLPLFIKLMCLPGIESSSYISISFLLKLTVKLIKLINVIELADCNFKCVCVWKICGESADRNDVSSVVVVVMVVALDLPFLLRLGSCNVWGFGGRYGE